MPRHHERISRLVLAASLFLFGAPLGCAADLDDDPSASESVSPDESALLDGDVVYDRPEVGQLRFNRADGKLALCTGTLVSSRTILTAAHCVSYTSEKPDGTKRGVFVIHLSPERSERFEIDGWESFGKKSEKRAKDVALVHITKDVPRDIAKPSSIAPRAARRGAEMSIYGYGCTDRGTHASDGNKRKFVFKLGTTNVLCPGDSGGPMFDETQNAVVAVNSAIRNDSRWNPFDDDYDLFGDAVRFRDRVAGLIARWK